MHSLSLSRSRARDSRPLWLWVLLLAVLTALAACSDSPQPTPVISAQPTDQSVAAGSVVTLSVAASGPDLAYQWQQSTDAGSTWTNIAGATQASHTTAATTAADNGKRYRVIVSAADIGLTSSAVQLTVTVAVVVPALTVQPAAQSATAPAVATFSVTATGTTPAYQWQRSNDGGATWTDIAGASAASYSTGSTDVSMNAGQYRVVVSNSAGSETSAAVVLSVAATPIAAAITTQPADQSVSAGSAAAFTVAATGIPTPTLQWQRSTDGGTSWSNIATATDATHNTGPTTLPQDGERYRALASNSAGSATSQAALLTVNPAPQAPAITAQPADQSVTAPAAATFSAAANGVPTPAWQWQLSTDDGTTWANINGATAASYATPATAEADNGKRYRAVASNASGSATSNSTTLTVNPAPQAPAFTTQPASQSVVAPGQASFTVAVTSASTPTLQWQMSADAGVTWVDVVAWSSSFTPGAASSTYATPATAVSDSGQRYRVVASNASGSVNSDAATLTVAAAPVAIAHEGFDYTLGERIVGQSGGSGWASAWALADSSGNSLDVSLSGIVASGLRYTDGAGNDLSTSGGAWQTDAAVAFGQLRRATTQDFGAPNTTRWISFLVKQSSITGGTHVAGATLGTTYAGGLNNQGAWGGISGSPVTAALADCMYCVNGGTPLPGFAAGSVAMVLMRIDFGSSGGGGLLSLWINPPPDPNVPLPTPDSAGVVGSFAQVTNGLTLLWGNGRSFTFDELRIAATRDAAAPFTPAPASAGTSFFFTDFETPLPPQIAAGTALIEGTQGFAGLGPTGGAFAGSMLRSETGNIVTITLSNLPAHSWLTLDFLLAAIDSLDGSGAYPSGDFFRVTLDGVDIFRESFANALPSQIQTYVPPPGVELARRVELGFWAAYPESAYWMGGDAIFKRIPHSGASAVITMRIEGAGIQSLSDESWGIDNLGVLVGP